MEPTNRRQAWKVIAGGIGICAMPFGAIAKVLEDEIPKWDREFDAIVVGSGYAGSAAMQSLLDNGVKNVVMIDKMPYLGGNSAYSGGKIAVAGSRFQKEENVEDSKEKFVADICASFQKTAIQHLCQKCKIFFEQNARDSRGWKHFGIIGGASANLSLREKVQKMCDEFGISLLLVPLEYCSDNAAMIGRVGLESYLRGEFSPLEIQTKPKIQSI